MRKRRFQEVYISPDSESSGACNNRANHINVGGWQSRDWGGGGLQHYVLTDNDSDDNTLQYRAPSTYEKLVFKKFITYAHKCDPGSRGSQVNLTPRRARVTRKGKSEIKTGLRNGQVCGKNKRKQKKTRENKNCTQRTCAAGKFK